MGRYDLYPIANLATGRRLPTILRRYREQQLLTHQEIAERLSHDYAIRVSRETIRKWLARLDDAEEEMVS